MTTERRPFRAALAFCLLVVSLPAFGGRSAEDAFEDGVAAYRAGQYESALVAFESAQRRGMDHPNLDLNLGLTHVQLGHLYEARASFHRVRRDLRYAPIADYQLGLLAARIGEYRAARDHFEAVQSTGRNTELRDLATVALRQLEDLPLEEGPETADVERPDALYYLRAATGFDSNPELANEAIDQPVEAEGAGYLELIGNVDHPLARSSFGTTAFRSDFHVRQHDSDEGYDQLAGNLGFHHAWRTRVWRFGAGGEGGAAWLDGEAYQSSGAAMLDARRAWGPHLLTVRYDSTLYAGEGTYAYLDGWRHRLEGSVARSIRGLRARGELELEQNDRRDLALGEEFSSYSPARRAVQFSVGTPRLNFWSVEWRARFRESRYRDPNVFRSDGVLVSERRDDRLWSTGLRARRRGGEAWNWLLDLQYSRNDSNLEAFGYERQVGTVGIEFLR